MRVISVYFIITIHLLSAGDYIYQEIRVFHSDPSTLQSLNNLGIPLDHVRKNKDESLDLVVTVEEAYASSTVTTRSKDSSLFFRT